MKKQIETTKNFIKRNKAKILIGTNVATLAALALTKVAVNQRDEFLKENDLHEAFWNQDEDEN